MNCIATTVSHQSFKTSPTSAIDTFSRVSLPGDAASLSYTIADDSRYVLPAANIANSSQSGVSTAGYFVCSPGYLSPTGSIKTAALRELQAFASQGGMEHVCTQSPDTTDTAGCQGYVESSTIDHSTCSVAADDSSHCVDSESSSPAVCKMCGRGCACQKHTEESFYRQLSKDSSSSWPSSSLKVESWSADCQCAAARSSSLLSLSSSAQQQQQPQHCDMMLDMDLFSTPLELSSTLRELSMAAREPPTGSTADLIEHTIQAVVDAHVNTCLYTSDKVATGLREYELMLSTKPPVSCSLCMMIM